MSETGKTLKDIILEESYKVFLERNKNSSFSPNREFIQLYTDALLNQFGYYADLFEALGCPSDMDETETKPSDYIESKLNTVVPYKE